MFNVVLINLCEGISGEVIKILQADSHKIVRLALEGDLKIEGDCDLVILTVQSLSQMPVHWLDRLLSYDIPIIVVCENCTIEVSMQLIRYGVVDCIAAEGCLDSDLRNACLKATKFSVRRSEQDNYSITVVPAYSTGDASLLAANVATAIAQHSGNSRLIDLNFRGSEVPTYFGIAPQNNIQHLFVDKHDIDDQLIEKAITRHASGVQLIGGPPTYANIEITDLYHVDLILRQLAERSKMVVLLENPTHIGMLSTLKESRRTIVTTQMNIVALRKTRHCLDLIKKEGVPANSICVVAFEIDQAGDIPFKYAAKLIDVDDVISLPLNIAEASMSLNLGVPTYMRLPNSDFSSSIRRYFGNLTGMRMDSFHQRKQSNRLVSLWNNFVQRRFGSSGVLNFN